MKDKNIFEDEVELVPLRDTDEWQKLFKKLLRLQNHEYNAHRDILTITGFMTTLEELRKHVASVDPTTIVYNQH